MKLNLLQFCAFVFAFGWVVGDVLNLAYSEKLLVASIGAAMIFHLNYKTKKSLSTQEEKLKEAR